MNAKKAPIPRRDMTDDEKRMAIALGDVTFVPGISSKRFARDLAAEASDEHAQITERQAEALRSLVHRYRRQIPKDVVALLQPMRVQQEDRHQ